MSRSHATKALAGCSKKNAPTLVSRAQDELMAGQHDARFTFDATGESRGERFSVKAGARVTVRAEFTGATPIVRIQR